MLKNISKLYEHSVALPEVHRPPIRHEDIMVMSGKIDAVYDIVMSLIEEFPAVKQILTNKGII